MRRTTKLPIGIENFEEIHREDFYYVDKTGMIRELLEEWGKVNLFTRPRRFGKSLNMSMLKYFFEYGCDPAVFSNAESGDGFSDILVESGGGELGIVIEVKYPDGGDLDKGCREALEQIERMGYEEKLRQEDVEKVLKYGIACNRKKCRVVKGQETDM